MTDRVTLTDKLFNLKEEKDELEKNLENIKAQLDEVKSDLINLMISEDLQSYKDDEYGTVYLDSRVFASIENQEVAFAWLREHNMGDVIKETIHSSTLSALAKDTGDIPGVKTHEKITLKTRKK